MFNHIVPNNEYVDLETKNFRGLRFYKTPEGVFLPSVTSILGSGEKPWLDNWKNMLGNNKAKQVQQEASERGTAVHAMIEAYLNNEDVDPICQQYPDKYVKLFNQIKLNLNKHVNDIYAQEVALWDDDLMTAGRVDLVAKYDGVNSIVDFKTSTKFKKEEHIEDYFLQSTAYALMYENLYGVKINQLVIIITTEQGFLPLAFKKPVEPYINTLVERISEFYNKRSNTVELANE